MNGRQGGMDWPLFAAILIMLGFGIVLVYSSSFALSQHKYGEADFYLARQSIRALLAIACFMICINVDYHQWGRFGGVAYLMAVALLVTLLFLPAHHAVNGARRWLVLGTVQFQVSDFARIALIIFLACKCEAAGEELRSPGAFFKLVVMIGIVCGLVLAEPNFSTAAIMAFLALAVLFVSGARFLHLGALSLAAVPAAVLLVLRTPYRAKRLISFLDLSGHQNDLGYQAYQSLVGLGNGGLFGAGIGKGEQKFFYLPEPHTDFAVSILGEEIGFIGLLAVFAVLAFIVYRGFRISLNAADRMGQLMAFGFTAAVAVYAIINAAVACGLMPTTGVPMPFLSYGGMSLVFTMSSMGIVLNIASRSAGRMTAREAVFSGGGMRRGRRR
ncbi:MAG: putative lipid II flippase FtsW [Chitinispirillaceae bacterium]|nr:putative lipid II flippase FtsW [Chitinispirillaceae bacterium]